ncbi:MAG: UDP-N-acetylglucosamine 2-epimerase (hydrolyzing), partial [Bacteroidetes bacterium]|nr:UDP-N-acetylglucosamine 2-epimerase (hydrolyzing) [Bacteroidota bacterium]
MKIAFFTTTRADFGLLLPLIRSIRESENIDYLLFAGGAHLKQEYGFTIDEIKKTGLNLSSTFDYLPSQTAPGDLLKGLAKETGQLAEIFASFKFDAICILGDRYELLPVVQAAILFRKGIIHLHGGEKSEGALDEQVRHMITKAAHLHFAACDEYADNIRRMGEQAWRVHNTGALGVDNMRFRTPVPKKELFGDLGLDENMKTILLTYHPVTVEDEISHTEQIRNLFGALEQSAFQVMITAPGAETDRELILGEIEKQVKNNRNYHFTGSLGFTKYLNLIPHCNFVIGNSSSGIIEVPYFKIPTINVGSRQQGRIRHHSVI